VFDYKLATDRVASRGEKSHVERLQGENLEDRDRLAVNKDTIPKIFNL
jgi:hypothetical protein